ncbi:hypothetical protein NIES4103_10820 [Nostoc sp. NIES-4103]|nr:hypothetical protein NIES4103_10820 [Nostoc sp. NIES-4103]
MKNTILRLFTFLVVIFFTFTSYAYAELPPPVISPNDPTIPTGEKLPTINFTPFIKLEVRNADGKFVPATPSLLKLNSYNGSLNLKATISDFKGISYGRIAFFGTSDSCSVGSTIYNGSYPILNLPAGDEKTYQSSEPLNKNLSLSVNLKGPLECKVLGNPTLTGLPRGAKVLVQVTGKNWSSSPEKSTSIKQFYVSLT